jgi:hypothetical protein
MAQKSRDSMLLIGARVCDEKLALFLRKAIHGQDERGYYKSKMTITLYITSIHT